jgi:hypothetical protein
MRIMQFMGISIGILALVATAMLLFGRRGTVKILAWLAVLVVLSVGGTIGFVILQERARQTASKPQIGPEVTDPDVLARFNASKPASWSVVGQSTDGRGDPIVSIDGVRVQIDKEFLSLPSEKQNATIKKIAASIKDGAKSGTEGGR